MSGGIFESMLTTERLGLYHLRNSHSGNRPRVLFLGGSNFDLRLKRAFLATPLVQEFDFATYEPRGIGRTEQPSGDWDMLDYAQDAISCLDALNWPDAHVIGESFGGMTALHLATVAPERVKSLTIASATAGGPDHHSHDISEFLTLSREEAATASLKLQDNRNAALAEEDPAAFGEKLAARLAFEVQFATPSIANGGYARLLDARRDHDCTNSVAQIQIPSLILAGRYDRQAHPDAQRVLSEALPRSEFQEYDAGHGVLFSDPKVLQAVTSFLAQHADRSMVEIT